MARSETSRGWLSGIKTMKSFILLCCLLLPCAEAQVTLKGPGTAKGPASFGGGAGGSSIALDQHGVAGNLGGGSTLGCSVNAANGSTVLLGVSTCADSSCNATALTCAGVSSMADGGTNTFTLVAAADGGALATPRLYVCIYKVTSWAGGTHTVTASDSSTSPSYVSIGWASFTGTTGTLDGAGVTKISSPPGLETATTSGNLTASNDLLFGFFSGTYGSQTWTNGSGFTTIDTTMFFSQAADEWGVGGTSGAPASATMTPAVGPDGVGAVVAIK